MGMKSRDCLSKGERIPIPGVGARGLPGVLTRLFTGDLAEAVAGDLSEALTGVLTGDSTGDPTGDWIDSLAVEPSCERAGVSACDLREDVPASLTAVATVGLLNGADGAGKRVVVRLLNEVVGCIKGIEDADNSLLGPKTVDLRALSPAPTLAVPSLDCLSLVAPDLIFSKCALSFDTDALRMPRV